MPEVEVSEIARATKRALMAHGAADWQAEEVARSTAHSEAHGNVICGLQYLESYCLQLDTGRVDGRVVPEVTRTRPGAVLANARCGFAQPAFAAGLPTALEAVRQNGIALFAVGQSHTCTSLGFFTEQIATAGIMAIGFTNASPVVAAPSGKKRVIGTNPVAMSVPGKDGGLALHFDTSTSAVALGKITMAKYAGEPIPLGWANDEHGQPTTDPEAALRGSLCSAGGHKGWAFGLMAEIMASAITGSVNSVDVSGLKLPEGPPHRLGQSYILIDPTACTDTFDDRLLRLAEAICEDPGARLPGQGRLARQVVSVPDALWQRALDLGQSPGT